MLIAPLSLSDLELFSIICLPTFHVQKNLIDAKNSQTLLFIIIKFRNQDTIGGNNFFLFKIGKFR